MFIENFVYEYDADLIAAGFFIVIVSSVNSGVFR